MNLVKKLAILAAVALTGSNACGMMQGKFQGKALMRGNSTTLYWNSDSGVEYTVELSQTKVDEDPNSPVYTTISATKADNEQFAQDEFPQVTQTQTIKNCDYFDIHIIPDEHHHCKALLLFKAITGTTGPKASTTIEFDLDQDIPTIDENFHSRNNPLNTTVLNSLNSELQVVTTFIQAIFTEARQHLNEVKATDRPNSDANTFIKNWIANNKPTLNPTHKPGSSSTPPSTKMSGAFDESANAFCPGGKAGNWVILDNWVAASESHQVEVRALEDSKATKINFTRQNSNSHLSQEIVPGALDHFIFTLRLIVTPAPTDTDGTTFNVLALYLAENRINSPYKWTSFEWKSAKQVDLHMSLGQAGEPALDDKYQTIKKSIQSSEPLKKIANIVTKLFDTFHSHSNTIKNYTLNKTTDQFIEDWLAENTPKTKDEDKGSGSKTPATLSFFERHRTKIITLGIVSIAAAVGGVGYYLLGQSEAEASGDTQ